ncbi:hypothetical protein SprV_0100015700 [Sparganum proliferum]
MLFIFLAPKIHENYRNANLSVSQIFQDFIDLMKQLNEASAALDAALERRQNREKEETLYRRARMMSSASFWESLNRPAQRSFNIGVPLPLNMRTSFSGTVYRKYSPEEKANLLQNLDDISQNYEQAQKLDDKIADLENDIASINLYSVENIKRMQVDDQRQRALEEKNSEGRQNKLRAEVDALKKEYEETMQQHRQKIKQANATRYKLESDLEGKYAAYDKAMFAIQSDYDRLRTAYLGDKAELEAYTEKLEALREEYDGIMEEKRQEEENERRAEEKRKKLDAAASVIQAFWRSFHARKLARGKAGRKGRKGGAKKR